MRNPAMTASTRPMRMKRDTGEVLSCTRSGFHMSLDQFQRFWDAFAREYTGKEDHSEFDALAGKFAAIDVIVRTAFQKPTFVEKLFFGMQVRKLVKSFY